MTGWRLTSSMKTPDMTQPAVSCRECWPWQTVILWLFCGQNSSRLISWLFFKMGIPQFLRDDNPLGRGVRDV
jgi:hypothetical protein